jgi:hypothetical protein
LRDPLPAIAQLTSDAMDELQDLREHIEHGRYAEALVLIGEMEEMSR